MKLDTLETFTIGTPPPGWGGRYWQIVKLTTACGIEGYGEVYAAAVGPAAMEAVIADVFARHMQGEPPRERRADVPPGLFLGLHAAPRPHGHRRILGP